MLKVNSFSDAIKVALSRFTDNTLMTDTWQGKKTDNHPAMAMHEILHFNFETILPTSSLDYYRKDIKPNLPWADDHFEERVCGHPLNPGVQWANWPYAKSADTFREKNGRFNHNYMQRYWPRYAGRTSTGAIGQELEMPILGDPKGKKQKYILGDKGSAELPHKGCYGDEYGDLNSVVSLLAKDPLTRQAFLPVWFPEDTGDTNPGRKPCTIGYHFLHRGDYMDITYYIRSMDVVRHARDDFYMTVRLLLWVLDELRKKSSYWENIYPGKFIFLCGSMHCFVNDYLLLKKEKK